MITFKGKEDELIDGIPFAMAPMLVPQHQWIAPMLAAAFIDAFKKGGCNCKVYQPLDYKLSNDTVFNSDLSVVCNPITKKSLIFPRNSSLEFFLNSPA